MEGMSQETGSSWSFQQQESKLEIKHNGKIRKNQALINPTAHLDLPTRNNARCQRPSPCPSLQAAGPSSSSTSRRSTFSAPSTSHNRSKSEQSSTLCAIAPVRSSSRRAFLNKERLLKLFQKTGRKELTKATAKSC